MNSKNKIIYIIIMPNISKKVIDVAEDVLEDTAEKLEDSVEFLMRPEVLFILFLIFIVICILMWFMKKDDRVEVYKYN